MSQANTSSEPLHRTSANVPRQKICLSMIVKDEAPVIARCLKSVRPLIDHWVIVDTGSTDGTPDIVRRTLQDIPGELYHRPWVDFGHNRSEALALARNHGDYSLVIDADDVIELTPGFRMPHLNANSYAIEIHNQGRRYWRTQIVCNAVPWRYEGVLHEFLSCVDGSGRRVFTENRSQKRLLGAVIRMSEGGARRRSSSAERFQRDAAILENGLQTETDPFLVSRYTFYKAQSYRDAGDKQKALQAYLERTKLGFWDQEIFISLYWSANLKADLGFDDDDVVETYLKAHALCRNRAEALHGAALFCRIKQRYQQGFDFAKRALKIRRPDDGLFLEQWIYDYGVLDEYAVNAYWIGRYQDCLEACRRLLREGKMPQSMHDRVKRNAEWAAEKIRVKRTAKQSLVVAQAVAGEPHEGG